MLLEGHRLDGLVAWTGFGTAAGGGSRRAARLPDVGDGGSQRQDDRWDEVNTEKDHMPTYVYEVVTADGVPGERFEVVQPMNEPPLTAHPETGQPVRRVILPVHIAGRVSPLRTERALSDARKLERLGFTKYVKSSDGTYEKTLGAGPKRIKKK
jgi:predicted nucleic acid-binding Zn ribbon protein